MRPRAWWAAAAPAVPVVALPVLVAIVVAFALDGAEGPLAFAAVVLLGSALLHGARREALPGTPTQNLGRILIVAAAVLGILFVLGVAFLTWLLSGLCGNECSDRPWQSHGALLALAFAAAAVATGVVAAWLWRRLGRRRSPTERTARGLTLLPAAGVGVVALVAAIGGAHPDPERLRPSGATTVVWTPCATPGGPSAATRCGTARGLRTAASAGTVLAVWRTADALRGATVRENGGVRRIRIASSLPAPEDVPAATAVTADPAGGFVAAWTTTGGVRFARVSSAGVVRGIPGVRPSPDARSGSGTPALALTATARGFVAFAVVREPDATDAKQRLRALALDRRLVPRGSWRTLRAPVPSEIGPAAVTADGRAAVTVGSGGVRTTVTVEPRGRGPRVLTDRVLVPGPGAARVERLPGHRDVPVVRFTPLLVDVAADRGGRVRSLWTARAPRSDDVPARVRQQWLLGADRGTPASPIAEDLLEPQLVPIGSTVGVFGLRPAGPGRVADTEVVLVREG